jgi:hypothetical protein
MHLMLTQLELARVREIHQEWLDRAAETRMPYPDFLRAAAAAAGAGSAPPRG